MTNYIQNESFDRVVGATTSKDNLIGLKTFNNRTEIVVPTTLSFETKYFCKRCGYETTCLSNYRKHLRRITLCKPKLREISIDDDIDKYVNVLNNKCVSNVNVEGLFLQDKGCTYISASVVIIKM